MSISAIAGSSSATPVSSAAGGANATSAASTAAATTNPYLITGTTTQTNADGTITIVTTYAGGSTSSTTEPNPNPVTNQGPLNPTNAAQQATLLTAQEQSQAGQGAVVGNPFAPQGLAGAAATSQLGTVYSTQV